MRGVGSDAARPDQTTKMRPAGSIVNALSWAMEPVWFSFRGAENVAPPSTEWR